MKEFAAKIDSMLNPLRKIAERVGVPLLDLYFRLYIAETFFRSGLARLRDAMNGTWDTQVFLFELEHPVPGLDPELAAALTMSAELVLPVLLALGLLTRVGAAGLFIMAFVINETYQENYQHLVWMVMTGAVFIHGPKRISIDHLLKQWVRGEKMQPCCPVTGIKFCCPSKSGEEKKGCCPDKPEQKEGGCCPGKSEKKEEGCCPDKSKEKKEGCCPDKE